MAVQDTRRRARRRTTEQDEPAGVDRAARPTAPARAPGGRRAVAAGVTAAGAAGAAGVALAAALGGSTAPRPLVDPGAVVRWGAPLARTVLDVAGLGTVGLLVLAVLLLRGPGGRATVGADAGRRLVRAAGRWSALWAVAAAASALLVLADAAGTPLHETLRPDVLPLVVDLQQSRALLAVAWLCALVAVGATRVTSGAGDLVLLALALAALLPPVLAGHAGHGEGRALALVALLVHVLAAAVWTGGLAGLVLHLRRWPGLLAAVMPRFSRTALGCCLAVGASGVVAATTRLPSLDDVLGSGYGLVVLAKVAGLGVLAALGAVHRARTMPALVAGRPAPLVRLAVVELAVVACVAGLAAGLGRTEPPSEPAGHRVEAAVTAPGATLGRAGTALV